jgi:hypothetical protein
MNLQRDQWMIVEPYAAGGGRMWREDANSEDLSGVSGARTRVARTTKGAGRYTALPSNPEWATEHVEQAWLGTLELSAWTWIAWTPPVSAISSTHNEHRNLKRLLERNVCPVPVKLKRP